MTRRSALALFALLLPTLAVLAGPSTQPARAPAYLDVGYTDGTTERKFNLSVDDLAFLRSAFPAKQAEPPPVVVPPPPALPVLTRMNAPATAERGDGLWLDKIPPGPDGVVRVSHVRVQGWRQNVVAMRAGTYALDDVRAIDAFRDEPVERNMGNGFFFGDKVKVTLTGCAGIGNGWQPDKPIANRTDRRAGLYGYWGSDVTVRWSLFAENAGAGTQGKGKLTVEDSFYFDNGFSIQGLAGPLAVRRCLVYDGHRWAAVNEDGKVIAMTGNVGVSAYGPTTIDGLIVAGGPRQKLADLAIGVKSTNGPALNGSKKYTGNTDGYPVPKGAKWVVKNFAFAGWTGGGTGGDAPPPKPDATYVLPPGSDAKLADLVMQARTTERPIPDIVAEAFRVANVPWAK